jgi:hypothetical protein
MASSATSKTRRYGTSFARHGGYVGGTISPAGRYTANFAKAPMASVETCLQYAEQCLALAARATSATDRARLLQMAQAWRELAAKQENASPKAGPGE